MVDDVKVNRVRDPEPIGPRIIGDSQTDKTSAQTRELNDDEARRGEDCLSEASSAAARDESEREARRTEAILKGADNSFEFFEAGGERLPHEFDIIKSTSSCLVKLVFLTS